jgi:hypothetical protein
MKTIFNPDDNKELIDRLQSITSDAKPFLGKMTGAQMVLHAQAPLKVALNKLKLKRGLVGILFGGIARKNLTGPKPFGKNLPTDKNFKVTGSPDLEKEKNKLIEYVQKIVKAGPAGITQEPHPFFGKIRTEEWDALMYKHLDYHLRQFGL